MDVFISRLDCRAVRRRCIINYWVAQRRVVVVGDNGQSRINGGRLYDNRRRSCVYTERSQWKRRYGKIEIIKKGKEKMERFTHTSGGRTKPRRPHPALGSLSIAPADTGGRPHRNNNNK